MVSSFTPIEQALIKFYLEKDFSPILFDVLLKILDINLRPEMIVLAREIIEYVIDTCISKLMVHLLLLEAIHPNPIYFLEKFYANIQRRFEASLEELLESPFEKLSRLLSGKQSEKQIKELPVILPLPLSFLLTLKLACKFRRMKLLKSYLDLPDDLIEMTILDYICKNVAIISDWSTA